MAAVKIKGQGYGYIDREGKIVIPAIYEDAEKFKEGRARVKKDGRQYFIDRSGREVFKLKEEYKEVDNFYGGLCRVSTINTESIKLKYYCDNAYNAGVWGYIDKNSTEIISSQYIFADDLYDDIAFVCKGKWIYDETCNERYRYYWSEQELWGAIDKTGKEIVPCIFDEIKNFEDEQDVYMAHFGGWNDGKWGVIDKKGNWVAEPVFEEISYEYMDGLFTFYEAYNVEKENLLGIYDIKQKCVLFEPQFSDVEFMKDGNICVEVYDETLEREIQKIINRNGDEIFTSVYSCIYDLDEKYMVKITDEKGSKSGLIDKKGNVIIPCKYDLSFTKINCEKRIMAFKNNKKYGLIDFNENVIVSDVYSNIFVFNDRFLTVCHINEEKRFYKT